MQVVAEHVFPDKIRTHGKRCQRANEQGQEQMVQMIKSILKRGCNKRKVAKTYLRYWGRAGAWAGPRLDNSIKLLLLAG
jgi:hypothetical protein